MSDQLTAAAQAMNVPEPIVERSARARATASGSSYEEVLTAWAGGTAAAPAAAPTAPTAPEEPVEEPVTQVVAGEEAETAPEPPELTAPAFPKEPVAEAEPEPEEEVEALPLGSRVGLAGKIGAYTGVVLGLMGCVLASSWLLGAASVAGEEGAYSPAVEVTTTRFLLGLALLSMLFGAVVAALSRAAAAWIEPGARIGGRSTVTVMAGAVVGFVLGLAAGAVMVSAFSEPVGGDEGIVLIRVIPGLLSVLVGGGVLGWLTASLVQLLGVPVGLDREEAAEVGEVRGRLSAAVGIPVVAVTLLAFLAIPLGILFFRAQEMAPFAAPVLAVLAAGSILGISAMSTSRPTMRLTLGEFMVGLAGVVTVIVIVLAVVQTRAGPEGEGEAPGPGGTVEVRAQSDISFDATSWTVPEGEVEFVYENEADIVHTLTIDGLEEDLSLRVETPGAVDTGSVALSPGTYTLYCDIRGHREAGMEGTLTVTEAPAAEDTAEEG